MQTITIPPGRVVRVLLAAVALLVLANTAAQVMLRVAGHDYVHGLVPLVDLAGEANLPTWFSTAALLACALLLALIAAVRQGDRFRRHWAGLALGFLYLSADEAARLHELLIAPVRAALHASGPFHFAWVIPALALVAVAALAYLPFLRALPADTRRRAIVAAALYLGGAVGMEMVGGAWLERFGDDAVYAVAVALEETLEMLGAAAFVSALLHYIRRHVGPVRLRVADGGERQAGPAAVQPLDERKAAETAVAAG